MAAARPTPAAPPPRGDFLKELLDRNMDDVVDNILSRLDFASLQSCLMVSPLWKKLVVQSAARQPGPEGVYVAAMFGRKARDPFLAKCTPEWQLKLKEEPDQKWQARVRNFRGDWDGWAMWIEDDFHTWKPLGPEFGGFRIGFNVLPSHGGGRSLLFVLSDTKRGLWDLDTMEWVWFKDIEVATITYSLLRSWSHPFSGPGFVGVWGYHCLTMYSLDDGAVLEEFVDDIRHVLVSQRALLILKKNCSYPRKKNSPQPYCLVQVGPDGVISKTSGHIAPPQNVLHSAWLYLDNERFLVAANGTLKGYFFDKPVETNLFVVWDLQEPVLEPKTGYSPRPPSSARAIASAVPLTFSNSAKFKVYCHKVIGGLWILNICPTDKVPEKSPAWGLDTDKDYILCFDKRRMELLDKLTVNHEEGRLRFKDVFRKSHARE